VRTYASMAEAMERLKIPFAPLAKPADLFDDPHLNQGGHMLDLHFVNGKRANIPGLPLEMDGHELTSIRMQPPRKGEHTRDVLGDLGYSAAQIDSWIADGVALLPE
jgi:crotonobetainyl-CoA:carnitine CoA-transferase CaiB-like acyl-CoA transferase